ncbi:MAG: hypothetical protein U0Z75_00615 [Deinococcaceae bacterium]
MIKLSVEAFASFLDGWIERGGCLFTKDQVGSRLVDDEDVDPYVFSGHVEALRAREIDGDLWETLADLDEVATSEDEAWDKIVSFYQNRDCVILDVEGDQYILANSLAVRLGLTP